METSTNSIAFPVALKGTKRSHAKRCCVACRKQKTRCELPVSAIDVPSSQEPLPLEQACHRCVKVDIPCIVFDDDSKRKRRKLAEPVAHTDPTEAPKRQSLVSPTSGSDLVGRFFYLFSEGSRTSSSNSSSSTPGISAPVLEPCPVMPITGTLPDRSILWRPNALLRELTSDQATPDHRSHPRIDPNSLSLMDPILVVDDALDDIFNSYFESYLLWMPHLPTPSELRKSYRTSPTTSSALLLSSIYLITSKNCLHLPGISKIQERLVSLIERHLGRVLLTANPDMHAVEALLLLAVYTPLDSSPSELFDGSALIAAARRISSSLNLSDAPRYLNRLRTAAVQDPIAMKNAVHSAVLFYNMYAWEINFALDDKDVPNVVILPPGIDPVEILSTNNAHEDAVVAREIGRLALAERVQSLQDVYRKYMQVCDMLSGGVTQKSLGQLSRALTEFFVTTEERRNDRYNTLAPFMADTRAALIHDWIELESHTKQGAILAKALVDVFYVHIGADAETLSMHEWLSELFGKPPTPSSIFISQWGSQRMDTVERILAIFAGLESNGTQAAIGSQFPTGYVTPHSFGAPISYTCAMVVSAAASLVESHAAIYSYWKKTASRVDSYILILRQVVPCLRAMGPERPGSVAASSANIVAHITDTICRFRRLAYATRGENKVVSRLRVDSSRIGPVSPSESANVAINASAEDESDSPSGAQPSGNEGSQSYPLYDAHLTPTLVSDLRSDALPFESIGPTQWNMLSPFDLTGHFGVLGGDGSPSNYQLPDEQLVNSVIVGWDYNRSQS